MGDGQGAFCVVGVAGVWACLGRNGDVRIFHSYSTFSNLTAGHGSLGPFFSILFFFYLSQDLVDLSFLCGKPSGGMAYFWMWRVSGSHREEEEGLLGVYILHLSIYPAAMSGLGGPVSLNIASRPSAPVET